MKSLRIRITMALTALLPILNGCGYRNAEQSEDATIIKREDIEWLRFWAPHTNDTGLPRILLIGDSITELFGPVVDNELDGKAYVVRLTTSKSLGDPALLDEVEMVLSQYDFDIIHVSNGLHGWDYDEDTFSSAIPALYSKIKSDEPEASIIWATCTPCRDQEKNERVKSRNEIIASFVSGKEITLDDLYNVLDKHDEYFEGSDGVHPNNGGAIALSKQVLSLINEKL